MLAALRPHFASLRSRAMPVLKIVQGRSAALRRFLARERTRKALRRAGLITLGIAVALALAFFALRNAVLRGVLDGRLRSFARGNPGTTVEVGTARFFGLAGVELRKIRLQADDGSLAVSLGRALVAVDPGKMLLGRVLPRRLTLSDLQVDLRPGNAPPAPASAGMRREAEAQAKKEPPGADGPAPDYGARAARLLDVVFRLIPDSVEIDRLTLHSVIDGVHQALYVPRLEFRGPAFETTLEVFDQGRKWACRVKGRIERDRKRLELRLHPRQAPGGSPLPFSDRQWGLKLGFESAKIVLASRGRRRGVLGLDGSLAVSGLALYHARIAADDVLLPIVSLDFTLDIGRDHFELRKPTQARLHKLRFQPAIHFQTRPARQLRLHIPETRFAAGDLFASLPAGLFTRLAGMRTSGELAFHLDFAIDLSRPEDLELDVDLTKRAFRIRRFGNADLRHFAGPFLYTAYEEDRPLRSFVVGPENPDFVPLADFPDFLKYSVMISEDGAFFSHNGFLLEPFKNSIAANLKAGRFVRGASTISMQLVKNLYLRRHKTVARKLEELLITWLIEENRLVSKERMLETYLNIIEWGPGVYGAREAARYYFAKEPAALTLAEAIFMAAIIPRPKRFAGFFDDEGRLRPWLQSYYIDVSRKMLARGWISQFDSDTLLPDVTLSGPARMLLKGAVVESAQPEDLVAEEIR
jgi:hypothetical protein